MDSFSSALDKLSALAFSRPSVDLTIDDLDKLAFVSDNSNNNEQYISPTPTKRKKTNSSRQQDLYVMTSSAFPGLVKVGRSNMPERRRLDLSGGQPVMYTLDVIFHEAGQQEQAVHKKLSNVRHTQGYSREWFACTPDDVIEAFRAVAPDQIEQIERRTVDITLFEP